MIIDRPLVHGPEAQTPDRIIVHALAHKIPITKETKEYYEREQGRDVGKVGEIVYAATWLDRLGLSAHQLVAPAGDVIRCREDIQGAWHARGFNTNSLGIEILVPGILTYGEFLDKIHEPWCRPGGPQFNAAVESVVDWCVSWNIPVRPGRIDRHSDVDPARKYDPGPGFPWEAFIQEVRIQAGRRTA